PFVHVDVNDLSAILDLLPGDGEGVLEPVFKDEPGEFWRAGNIRALADIDEIDAGTEVQRLEAAQPQIRFDRRRHPRRQAGNGFGHRADMGRGGSATAADNIEPA